MAYSDKINADESSDEMIVVGSIYGGMVFSFENGKVKQIFIGAGAE